MSCPKTLHGCTWTEETDAVIVDRFYDRPNEYLMVMFCPVWDGVVYKIDSVTPQTIKLIAYFEGQQRVHIHHVEGRRFVILHRQNVFINP